MKPILYYNTIKWIKPFQIYLRLLSVIKKQCPVSVTNGNNLCAGTKTRTEYLFHDANCPDEILKGNYNFLNETEQLNYPPSWQESKKPLLWRFNLHYFNYLHLLSVTEKLNIAEDWVIKNRPRKGVGWHPYPTAIRIVNWCKNRISSQLIISSLELQCEYLYRNMETYHPANHLLENAKALIICSRYLNNSSLSNKWYNQGKKIIEEEMEHQLLKDGSYFELSPMYHNQILWGLLDIYNTITNDKILEERLRVWIIKMLYYSIDMSHPGGRIVCFNDSSDEITPRTVKLLEYAYRLGITVNGKNNIFKEYREAGHYVYRGKYIYLAADFGKIGPNNIPAHAHADIFTYELSAFNIEFIVDTGVYEYTHGEKRSFCRSTYAHNTVTIDRRDQAEMWGSFRVARRYAPEDVKGELNGGHIRIAGTYSGYANLIGDKIIHKRNIVIDVEGMGVIIADFISGENKHSCESCIHLHYNASIKYKDAEQIIVEREGKQICIFTENKYRIEESEQYPQFGQVKKCEKIVLYSDNLPTTISYKIFALGN